MFNTIYAIANAVWGGCYYTCMPRRYWMASALKEECTLCVMEKYYTEL